MIFNLFWETITTVSPENMEHTSFGPITTQYTPFQDFTPQNTKMSVCTAQFPNYFDI